MLNRIDRYVTTLYIKSFFFSMFGFIGIFIISQLFKVIRYIAEGRLAPSESFLYIFALLPDIIVNTAPLATVLAGLITSHRMSSSLEIIALKTSGISIKRIILFPVIFSFFISLGVYYVFDELYPKGVSKSRNLKRVRDVSLMEELPKAKRKAFLRGNDSHVYYADLVNRERNIMRNVQILILNDDFSEIQKIINAKLGTYNVENKIWVLRDVIINDVINSVEVTKKVYTNPAFTEEPELFFVPVVEIKEKNVEELKEALTVIKRTGGDYPAILSEIANRRSFPFASVIVSMIGLALGSRYVRGTNKLTMALSLGLGYGYYILQSSSEVFSESGFIHPFLAYWIPNIIFIIIGLYLVNRAEY